MSIYDELNPNYVHKFHVKDLVQTKLDGRIGQVIYVYNSDYVLVRFPTLFGKYPFAAVELHEWELKPADSAKLK